MRKIVSIGLLLFLFMVGLSVFFLAPSGLRNSLRQSNLNSLRDKANQQRKGNQKIVVDWRSLEIIPRISLSDEGTTGNIIGGDFNGDGNQEILFLPKEGKGIIYMPDGTEIPTALNGAMLQPAGAWDYDLDGKLEIFRIPLLVDGYTAAFDEGRTFQLELLSLDGVVIATLDGLAVKNPELVFDYDGDSNADIALLTGKAEFTIYGSGGIILTRLHTNGDEARDPWLPVIKALPASANQLGGGYSSEDISGAVCISDVDANSELELVTLQGILDLQSGGFTHFNYLKSTIPDQTSNLPPTVGDYFSTGFKLVAVPTALKEMQTLGITVFDRAGTAVATSEVGYSLLGLLTIQADGRDYLVAHAPDKILIFP